MKKINMHGLNMEGLRAASGATCTWAGYTQISYDLSTGEILIADHSGTPESSWTEYHDSSVITVLNARGHVTMQQIADAIYAKVCEHRMMVSN